MKNTEAKAIKKIREYKNRLKFYSINKSLDIAIDALEKRIPKRLNNIHVKRDFYGHPFLITGDCPTCGASGINTSTTNYCYCCGQRVDGSGWEESE